MNWLDLVDTSRVLLFAYILTRVSGIVIVAPVFGGSDIPMQFRALFAFSLAILITPIQWNVPIQEPTTLPAFAIMIGGELLVGLVIGLGVNMLFTGLYTAGDLIGRIGGLSASQLFDPVSGEQVPVLGRFLQLLGIVVFACVGGLRLMIGSLIDTFEAIPPGSGNVNLTVAESMITIVSVTFSLAFRVAAPATVGILVSMIAMGVLGRTLPQLNLMSVGFGINTMIMFIVLLFTIGTAMWCFQERFIYVLDVIFNSLFTAVPLDYLE